LISKIRRANVHRASESIGALAAALAKAQIQLVNPEKSLFATIREEGKGGREQTFRYAPLSSGLEIVRKVLGQHEIATVQTTSIDQPIGFVNLTTVLAHASGEWIASDWPVCPVSEVASPRRMGAALTYARRYALFALVGIAGEDDVDAPDLQTTVNKLEPERPSATNIGPSNGGREYAPQAATRPEGAAPPRSGKMMQKHAEPNIGLHASAKLRERLITEIRALRSSENITEWARQSLPEKNRLRVSDAAQVEEVFEQKLEELTASADDGSSAQPTASAESSACSASKTDLQSDYLSDRFRNSTIDKGVLTLPEPRRIRDRDHIESVAGRPCLVCGRLPSDPHHLRFAQSRALSRKVSDEFTVPLCRGHHVSFTATAMKRLGGASSGSTRWKLRARCGSSHIPFRRHTRPSRSTSRQAPVPLRRPRRQIMAHRFQTEDSHAAEIAGKIRHKGWNFSSLIARAKFTDDLMMN
jgi:ERF superfamily